GQELEDEPDDAEDRKDACDPDGFPFLQEPLYGLCNIVEQSADQKRDEYCCYDCKGRLENHLHPDHQHDDQQGDDDCNAGLEPNFSVMRIFPFSFDLKLITVYHKFYFSLKHTQNKKTRNARTHESARRRMVSSEYPDRPECPKQEDCQYPGEALRKQ